MKTCIRFVLLIFCLQLAFVQTSSAQKLIRIDESLKLNSQQMRAKRKGVSSVGKYEFGTYKVISGKGGVGDNYAEINFEIFAGQCCHCHAGQDVLMKKLTSIVKRPNIRPKSYCPLYENGQLPNARTIVKL